MAIWMIGIDHNNAGIDVRTVFSFTKKRIGEALESFKRFRGFPAVFFFLPATGVSSGQAQQKNLPGISMSFCARSGRFRKN